VSVAATEQPGSWLLAVRDTGPGVGPALRPRLFERFARSDEARNPSTGGAGLGLSPCAAIVHANGGVIFLVDSDGPGAHFVVRLPARTVRDGDSGRGNGTVPPPLETRRRRQVGGRPQAPGGAVG
jgi:signal transduction histidine kinase